MSTFYANDETRLIWQDDQTDLIPKTIGSSLMVSEFMCPCHGRMCDISFEPVVMNVCVLGLRCGVDSLPE